MMSIASSSFGIAQMHIFIEVFYNNTIFLCSIKGRDSIKHGLTANTYLCWDQAVDLKGREFSHPDQDLCRSFGVEILVLAL